MDGWKDDKKWSDQFLSEIKQILGLYLIGEPPLEEDQERNTDLIVLKMEAVRIGCRIRRDKYLERYGNEFTIRTARPRGNKTELAKIIEGWGDYFFYGFGSDGGHLMKWSLCNLKVFRLWYNTQLYKRIRPGIPQRNKDGSSNFLAFKFQDIPECFILASSANEAA